MVTRTQWIDRKFNFDFPVGLLPCIIERLRGTSARLEEMLHGVPDDRLSVSSGGWTIKQNVGHLADVQPLWDIRMDQFMEGLSELEPADMSNQQTAAAQHDAKSLDELLTHFRQVRDPFVRRLEELDDETAARTAHHPRLNQPMRIVDLALFAAEHDDQHLATVSEILHSVG